jgi:hypothetical protein
MTHQITVTAYRSETKILPEVENYEQVIEKGTNLTLTYIEKLGSGGQEIKWKIPPITRKNEVITK